MLSALAVQGAVLRTAGQALYLPWDGALRLCGMSDRILRFRVTLSVCTFFCAPAWWSAPCAPCEDTAPMRPAAAS